MFLLASSSHYPSEQFVLGRLFKQDQESVACLTDSRHHLKCLRVCVVRRHLGLSLSRIINSAFQVERSEFGKRRQVEGSPHVSSWENCLPDVFLLVRSATHHTCQKNRVPPDYHIIVVQSNLNVSGIGQTTLRKYGQVSGLQTFCSNRIRNLLA